MSVSICRSKYPDLLALVEGEILELDSRVTELVMTRGTTITAFSKDKAFNAGTKAGKEEKKVCEKLKLTYSILSYFFVSIKLQCAIIRYLHGPDGSVLLL